MLAYKMEYEYKCPPSVECLFSFIVYFTNRMFKDIGHIAMLLMICIGCIHGQQYVGQYLDIHQKPQYLKGDSLTIRTEVQLHIMDLWQKGYLTASLDSASCAKDTCIFYVYYGSQFDKLNIHIDSSDLPLIHQASLGRSNQRIAFDQNSISRRLKPMLTYLENNGYPFASVKLKNLHIDPKESHATLYVETGPRITYDSLALQTKDIVSNNYLYRYLQIYPGQPYKHREVTQLKTRLNNLAFLELRGDPTVQFVNQEAKIILPIVKKRASRFDFIVGLVPDDRGDNRDYTITGEFMAEMVNRLGVGESIFLQIRRLRPEVQELKARVSYPYVFNTPIALEGDFQLFRNSNTFLEVRGEAGLALLVHPTASISIQVGSYTNRLQQIDSLRILQSRRLPSQLDVSTTSGILGARWSTLDYRFNPTKGIQVNTRLNLGVKNILKNQEILSLSNDQVDFMTAYDSLEQSTFQLEYQLATQYFIPINNWSSVKVGIDGGIKYNTQQLFTNEQFRIGGNKRLRGFEEETIITDRYAVGTMEYRILLDRNSHLAFPIVDYAFFRTNNIDTDQLEWQGAIGIGLGLNFGTPTGVFNISFVAGGRQNIPLNLQQTKIHFGYVNLF